MRISDWSSDVCSSDLLGFLFLGLRQGLAVTRDERAAGIDLARDQYVAHEDVARFLRIQAAVVDRLLRREHKPEQRHLLAAYHPPLAARPARVEVAAREQERQLDRKRTRLNASR